MPRTVEAQYIESGTFQGGEEDVDYAKIKPGETVIIVKKSDFKKLEEQAWMYQDLCK